MIRLEAEPIRVVEGEATGGRLTIRLRQVAAPGPAPAP
jgi:hypothetical protein